MQAILTETGGFVTVESEEGLGTTFRLYFPAIDVAIGTPDAAAGDRPHKATILVVDDGPALLEVTGRILRKNGHTTLQARTCELITQMKPRRLVLHMSGSAGALDPDLIRDGQVAFIQKPFTGPALLEKYTRC